MATRDWLCGTVGCPAFLAIQCLRPDASSLGSCGRRGDEAIDAIGLRLATRALLTAVAGIQHRLEHAVGQRRRKVNLDPPRGAARDAQRLGDLPVGDATFVFEPQDLEFVASTLSRRASVPQSSFL